jgi:hypothetical protein
MGRHGLDCSGSGKGQVTGACACGNEPPGSIKWGEFLDLLRKDSAPRSLVITQYVNKRLSCKKLKAAEYCKVYLV